MATRDYISEIIEIRERRSSNNSHSESFFRLSSLKQAFKLAPKDNLEILKYFPIALVATMEGCFRVMLAELVDYGQPFLNNCDNLLKNQKISFNLIKALHGQQVTVGEFVSHVVSINKLADIDSLISVVTGDDFLKVLKSHCSRWDTEILKNENAPIISDPDETYKGIVRTFELRHIFCHETATKVDFDYQEIEKCFLAVSIFIKASVDYISDTIHPNAPLTQMAMNVDSSKSLNKIIEEAVSVKNQIVSKLTDQSDRIEKLELSHAKWLEYQESFSTYCADQYKGGSIWPLIYNTAGEDLAKSYLTSLKSELKSVDEY